MLASYLRSRRQSPASEPLLRTIGGTPAHLPGLAQNYLDSKSTELHVRFPAGGKVLCLTNMIYIYILYIYVYIYIYIWDVLSFQITETLPVELMIEDGSQGESSQKYWKPGVFLV